MNLKNEKIRELYDDSISSRYGNQYEFKRWFASPRLCLDYFMMYSAISEHTGEISFKRCLEFGPGPGTWTRLLFRARPEASFDLVDISKAMKEQFHLEMRESENVSYHVRDIMHYRPERKFDFFFSSRAIEYLDDKEAFFKHLSSLLEDGGTGVIVTKNPNFGRRFPWSKRDGRFQHTGQISISDMEDLLKRHGFSDIQVFPAIMRMPLFDAQRMAKIKRLFLKFFKAPLKDSLVPFCESYLIRFKKNEN